MAMPPNLLSCGRLLLVPLLLALAWSGKSGWFLACLILSILTDMADGNLARRWKITSELGARLDSLADFTTSLSLPVCAWWLRPDVVRQEAGFLAVCVFFFLAPIAFGFLKYRRLTSYHTWGAKLMFVVMSLAVPAMFAGGPGWLLRVLAPLVVISQIDEMAITTLLPEWRANVPSCWHAWRMKSAPARNATRPE
jgi:CDP-diacylglycerol--glycerol-3-phosphate 3-phosphatidyltransferase